jgi:sulfofructosephosphate aldolase
VRLAADFIAAAQARGVLSVLEPVVRPTAEELTAGGWDQEAAIREAAEELSALRPSLTKVQVPLTGKGTLAEQLAASKALNDVIATPWVVLSQGVDPADYASAVEAACKAGASGFLAGRALWSDVVGAADLIPALKQTAVPRLERLIAIVNRYGCPWGER